MSGTIPTNYYESGFLFSFEPDATPVISGINNVLLIGQANTIVSYAWNKFITNGTGTYAGFTALGNAVVASDIATVASTYGLNSVISKMYTAYRAADPLSTVYLLPVPDQQNQTANSATLNPTVGALNYSFCSNASAFISSVSGTLNAEIAGVQVQSQVYYGDTVANVMTNLANAVNSNLYLPCTASVTSNANAAIGTYFTLTATADGIVASDVDFRFNTLGQNAGQNQIPGLYNKPLVISAASGFSGNAATGIYTATTTDPELSGYLGNLAQIQFDAIVTPYTSGDSMTAYNTLLNNQTGRWSYISQLFGFVFTGRKDNFSNLVTFGASQNTQFVSCLGMPGVGPATAGVPTSGWFGTSTTIYEMVASYAGACIASLSDDPGTPLQALTLNINPPGMNSVFTPSQYNTLLQNGIAIAKVGAGNTVILNRAVTMYQTNNLGIPDITFKDTTTMFVLEYVIETFKANLSQQFARVRLVDPQTPIPQGSDFVSTTTIESAAVGIYANLNVQGYVSNVSGFAQNVSATSAGNGRVNLYCPITLASPLIQLAVNFVVALT